MANNVNAVSTAAPAVLPGGVDHSNHGAAAPAGAPATSFGAVLSQAMAQGAPAASHAGHGAAPTGNLVPGSATALQHTGGHSASTDAHPAHFPIGGQQHREGAGLQGTALGVRAYRQQLLAANIANADTPGYKAVDIDYEEVMRMAQSAVPPLALATSAPGHLAGSAPAQPMPLKYHVPMQASADGNTVEMDVERTKFAENATMFKFSLDRVSGHFKMMSELFRDMKP